VNRRFSRDERDADDLVIFVGNATSERISRLEVITDPFLYLYVPTHSLTGGRFSLVHTRVSCSGYNRDQLFLRIQETEMGYPIRDWLVDYNYE
jgi:hypothetical protein